MTPLRDTIGLPNVNEADIKYGNLLPNLFPFLQPSLQLRNALKETDQ